MSASESKKRPAGGDDVPDASSLLNADVIEALVDRARTSGGPVDGVNELLNQLTKAVLERALNEEITDHLGYEHGDPAGHGSGNSRNGKSGKTVSTVAGPVRIDVPRDRNSSFEPRIVPKGARRIGQLDDMILSLYSRGMSTRDIQAHLGEVYGVDASPALISKVTDVVADEITLWQNRPVDEVYPIVYVDAIRIRVRDKGVVTMKAAHLVVAVDVDGRKHVLGIWIAENEGAKFWNTVITQLRNRGLKDILIACCDGLTGLPEAITSVFPQGCGANLCRARHAQRHAVRLLQGPQEDRRRHAGHLYRDQYRHRRPRVERPGQGVGRAIPGRHRCVAARLERVRSVPRLPARAPQGRVHH